MTQRSPVRYRSPSLKFAFAKFAFPSQSSDVSPSMWTTLDISRWSHHSWVTSHRMRTCFLNVRKSTCACDVTQLCATVGRSRAARSVLSVSARGPLTNGLAFRSWGAPVCLGWLEMSFLWSSWSVGIYWPDQCAIHITASLRVP